VIHFSQAGAVRISVGRQVERCALFAEVRLADRASTGDLLRRFDALLDLGFAYGAMAPHYGAA
jgi:hypothetical protein